VCSPDGKIKIPALGDCARGPAKAMEPSKTKPLNLESEEPPEPKKVQGGSNVVRCKAPRRLRTEA